MGKLRGLSVSGRKSELIDRLVYALIDEFASRKSDGKFDIFDTQSLISPIKLSEHMNKKNKKKKLKVEKNSQTLENFDEISLDNLMTLSHAELRYLCKELNQSLTGSRSDLAQRLLDTLWKSERDPRARIYISRRKTRFASNEGRTTWKFLLTTMSLESLRTVLQNHLDVSERQLIRLRKERMINLITEALARNVGPLPP